MDVTQRGTGSQPHNRTPAQGSRVGKKRPQDFGLGKPRGLSLSEGREVLLKGLQGTHPDPSL